MKKNRILSMIAPLILFPFIAFADAEEKTDDMRPTMLDTIYVHATKTDEKRQDIPNTVLRKDDQDILFSPALSLGDLLDNEPGLDWRTYGDYGGAAERITIRGMGEAATQVRVNGLVVNSPSLGSSDVAKIPLSMISSVEVTKGSGSLLYGSGAMGGTINITTKRPVRDETILRAEAGYGSEDTYELTAEVGSFLSEDFGVYMAAGQKETDGHRSNGDLDHFDYSANIVWDKGKALDISLYLLYVDREFGAPGTVTPEGTQPFTVGNITLYDDESANLFANSEDEDFYSVLNVKSSPVSWMDIHLRGDYSKMENTFYNLWNNSFAGTLEGLKSITTNDIYGLEGNIGIAPFENAKMVIGSEYKKYDWENEGTTLDGNGQTVPDTHSSLKEDTDTVGIYAEAQYRPSAYFKGLVGFRHEDHSEFGTEDLTRLGVVINPSDTLVIKASHGKHFLAPTPNDLFWPDDGFTRGNPDLDPETGYHSDITVEKEIMGDTAFVTASWFYWDVDDKIQWGPNSEGVWEPENLRTYEAQGIELGIQVKPVSSISMALNYTYLDAEEENKDYSIQDYGWPPDFPPNFEFEWVKRRAAHTPRHLVKGIVTYRHDSGLSLSAVVRYVDDRLWYRTETDGSYPNTKTVRYKMNDYWTMDAKAVYRFSDNWSIDVQANNIFDEEYETSLNTFTNQDTFETSVVGYQGAGASVFCKLRYEY